MSVQQTVRKNSTCRTTPRFSACKKNNTISTHEPTVETKHCGQKHSSPTKDMLIGLLFRLSTLAAQPNDFVPLAYTVACAHWWAASCHRVIGKRLERSRLPCQNAPLRSHLKMLNDSQSRPEIRLASGTNRTKDVTACSSLMRLPLKGPELVVNSVALVATEGRNNGNGSRLRRFRPLTAFHELPLARRHTTASQSREGLPPPQAAAPSPGVAIQCRRTAPPSKPDQHRTAGEQTTRKKHLPVVQPNVISAC